MRNQLLFLFFSVSTLFFISCDKKSGDPFTINGTITGAENKKIILETMTFPEAGQPKYTIIDTVTADKEGKFTIKNHLPDHTYLSNVRVNFIFKIGYFYFIYIHILAAYPTFMVTIYLNV